MSFRNLSLALAALTLVVGFAPFAAEASRPRSDCSQIAIKAAETFAQKIVYTDSYPRGIPIESRFRISKSTSDDSFLLREVNTYEVTGSLDRSMGVEFVVTIAEYRNQAGKLQSCRVEKIEQTYEE